MDGDAILPFADRSGGNDFVDVLGFLRQSDFVAFRQDVAVVLLVFDQQAKLDLVVAEAKSVYADTHFQFSPRGNQRLGGHADDAHIARALDGTGGAIGKSVDGTAGPLPGAGVFIGSIGATGIGPVAEYEQG